MIPCSLRCRRLQVKVAEWSGQRAHHVPNCRRLARIPHVQHITKLGFPGRRRVRPRDIAVVAAVHLCLCEAGSWVEQLPVCPHAVHHAVVRVERWIAGRSEEVTTWVAANCVVDAAVWADLNCIWDAFGDQTVCGDVGCAEEVWKLLESRR